MPSSAPVSLGSKSSKLAPSTEASSAPVASVASVASASHVTSMQAPQTGSQESRHVMADEEDFSSEIMADFSADTVITFLDRLVRRMEDSVHDNEDFHLPHYKKKDVDALYVQGFVRNYLSDTSSPFFNFLSVWSTYKGNIEC